MSTQEPCPISDEARALLRAALALRPRALLSDIDGTLSAIAPTPEQATLLPGIRDLLVEAQRVFDVVAVVSGRAASDALRMVGVPGLISMGSHGLERLESEEPSTQPSILRHVIYPPAEPYREHIAEALAAIGSALAPRYPGLLLEDKGVTASVHVRQTADPPATEAAVFAIAKEITGPLGLRVTRGRLVVELRPPVEMNKGLAIAELIHERGLRSAIYLGDDTTDRDAFRALKRLTGKAKPEAPSGEPAFRGVGIAVLSDEAPPTLAQEANIALDTITQVPMLLRWLVTEGALL